jgi:catechol 2,3-dioxygenase-like lactoylglutathione lyase family enzyme
VIRRSHFVLFVRDQATSTRFFIKVLGLRPTTAVPGMTEFELGPSTTLGLMPEAGVTRLLGPAVDPTRAGGAPRAELYLVVEDPGAYHARAIAAGGREISPLMVRGWGHEASYCSDPDGHVIAFAREMLRV